jgi:pimeloyl-ACP methyl ester carboxylesterase
MLHGREGASQESVQAISPRYGEIDVPVMILAGSRDQVVDVEGNVRALGQALPNGRVVLVEGSGHKLQHTPADIVRMRLGRCRRRLDGRGD